MSYRSTVLIVIIAFGVLFSLLYSSAYIMAKNKENLFRELHIGREEASIVRMINPDQICFGADRNLFDRYPTLLQDIKMADEEVRSDASTYGNYYTGVGSGLNKTQMFSLMSEFDFKLATSLEQTPNKLFTHQYKHLTCGFSYSSKYYQLGFTFTSLESINRDRGYVPIKIGQGLVDKTDSPISGAYTHAPFNNTAVFFNGLDSPVTVALVRKDTGDQENRIIPPNKILKWSLGPISPVWITLPIIMGLSSIPG